MKPAILLDCDTGIDDALTLLYLAALVRSGEAELVAAGTVHGNVAPDVGALNTLRVLERAGLADVPVAVGAVAPMAQPTQLAADQSRHRSARPPAAARSTAAAHRSAGSARRPASGQPRSPSAEPSGRR